MYRILDAYDRLPANRRFSAMMVGIVATMLLGLAADRFGAAGAGQAGAIVALCAATLVRVAHVSAGGR